MAELFETQALGSLLAEKGYIRGPFGSALKRGELAEEGIPVYEQKNAIENSREFRFFVTPEKFEELKRFQVKANDLIISCSGTVGKISIIGENDPKGIISQALLILRPDIEKITVKYFYYFLSSRQGFYLITQASHGSVQVNIAERKVVETIPVPTPETTDEQKDIASVLSSLDDKIELLHRQNKTLEAMAETLFRQWFVEEAQEDWENGKVSDLFVLQRGYDLPAQDRVDGPYPILAASGYSGGHADFKVRGPGVTTGRSGLLGKVFFVLEDFWPLNTSLYIKKFKRGSPLFSYFFLKTLSLDTYNAGSAVPTLNRNHVHEENLTLPPPELIARFEETALPLYRKIKQNELQSNKLEILRDTLLPKLMSGEVRVDYEH